jgi:hypothetical protein
LIIVGVLFNDDKLIAGVMESMKIKNKASSLTTPVILIKGNNNTGDNLSPEITTSVSLTLVNNLWHRTGDKYKVANISANFRKNSKWPLVPGGTQIHEKKPEAKNLVSDSL